MKQSSSVVAVVGNYKFLKKYLHKFISELTVNGCYDGEVLVLTSYFTPTFLIDSFKKYQNLTIIRFPNISFSQKVKKRYLNLKTINGAPNRFKTKRFQWHKLHLFNSKLKKWKYVLYMDINFTIHHDITPLLELKPKYLLAKCDGYPDYERTLNTQFDNSQVEFKELSELYNLDSNKYFQTGLLYYNTEIINIDTFNEIKHLAERYPISLTNEQGILNLYFHSQNDIFEELPEYLGNKIIYYYWMIKDVDIIITKQLREQYK
tara:strand:+ start:181 stop:966 length:786 start_codon:yes stop_codon:yes gene_type:complete